MLGQAAIGALLCGLILSQLTEAGTRGAPPDHSAKETAYGAVVGVVVVKEEANPGAMGIYSTWFMKLRAERIGFFIGGTVGALIGLVVAVSRRKGSPAGAPLATTE